MAVSWPDLKAPLILYKILLAFVPENKQLKTYRYVNIQFIYIHVHMSSNIENITLG